jgi:hypothetical protein
MVSSAMVERVEVSIRFCLGGVNAIFAPKSCGRKELAGNLVVTTKVMTPSRLLSLWRPL